MSSTQSKSDDHLIFASDCEVNGRRSNYKLGLVTHSESARIIDSYGNSTDCFRVGETFEPCDEARGEVARASLYGAVLYGYDLAENFTSQALCLDWNKSHPISEREKRRNNVLQKLQKNRNPFTDHPEFAKMIYDSSYTGAGALNDTSF
jgi:endonuclease I